MDKEREESKNANGFIQDIEGLIIFIETFFERLEQEKMNIEEPLRILKHLLSMLNRKKEKWEKEGKKEKRCEDCWRYKICFIIKGVRRLFQDYTKLFREENIAQICTNYETKEGSE